MKNLKLLDTKTAEAAGFRPLTIGYLLPQERPMLDNVLADMRRGNINHCLVKTKGGASVWRAGIATGLRGACSRPTEKQKPQRRKKRAAGKSAQHRKGKRS
jgi:hypothetical protein